MTRLRRRNGLCGSCLRKSSGRKRGTGTLHLRPAYDRSERRSEWEYKASLPQSPRSERFCSWPTWRGPSSPGSTDPDRVILIGVVLALAFGFMRKGSSGGS